MIWFSAVSLTLLLIFLTISVSLTIGFITAVSAWWSNKTWAYYFPLLILGVPPYLLTYFLSDFGYINPWIGAAISLGVCCSVYPHVLISASLANRAHRSWEMMIVVNGKNFKSLLMAIWPSLKLSLLPSIAIIAAEVVADWGVSNFYGINTLTMMTYNVWTSTWDMSLIIWGLSLLAVFGILISRLDLMSLTSIQNDNTNKRSNFWGAVAITPTILLLGFGIFKSLQWIFLGAEFHSDEFFRELTNTLYLTIVTIIICLFTVVLYFSGIAKGFLERTGLGFYAIPGTVIGAVVLYIFGSWVSLFVLLTFAITLRYYGLIINTVAVSDKGNQRYFEVIDLYSSSRWRSIVSKARIILPSVAMGVCLIVLDVIRELPISMILQPMNFQTLAMRMNYIARNENIPMLAPHGLVILILGIVLSFIIIKLIHDTDKKSKL
jgi:iron(III) transport system permease protein